MLVQPVHWYVAECNRISGLTIYKALPFSEPKQPTAEKTGFGGEGE
jgi:hypothetical protein